MNTNFDYIPTIIAALLGVSVIAYGVQKYLHLVNQLSAKLSDVNNRLDTLSETTRHDFATQWQRQFQSTLAEQQNELETIIKVQAEQLAKQSKQISWMNNVMTQNIDTCHKLSVQFNEMHHKNTELKVEVERLESITEIHDKLLATICSASHGLEQYKFFRHLIYTYQINRTSPTDNNDLRFRIAYSKWEMPQELATQMLDVNNYQ